MSHLQQRQDKIAAKRKQTSFRDFLMEIASWFPVNLYKETGIISRYPLTNRLGSIQKTTDFNENRESIKNEKDFYNQDFLEALSNLQKETPFPATINYGGIENCDYADITHNSKNVYLSFNSVRDTENVCYSMCIKDQSRNIYNSLMVRDGSDNIYHSKCVIRSQTIYYSKYIHDSSFLWFCSNCVSCYECIGCSGLEHKKYCINNKQHTEAEYKILKNKILSSKNSFDLYFEQVSNKGNNISSQNVEGIFNVGSENIINGYMSYHTKNGRNLFISGSAVGNSEMYDNFIGGSSNSSHYYGTCASGTSEQLYCCDSVGLQSSYMFYCINCMTCSFCLGCIGLKNKSYCIFNKQYTKEERYEKVDKIFSQMESDGTLGQFLPASMNPFYFNDTAAYLIDPSFTKKEVTAKGYLRREEPIKVDIPADAKVVKIDELEDYEGRTTDSGQFISSTTIRNSQSEIKSSYNRSINADILKYVIQDELGNYYRIIPMEYKFLVKHGLPLPRKHWLERMKENFRIN